MGAGAIKSVQVRLKPVGEGMDTEDTEDFLCQSTNYDYTQSVL